MDVWLGKVCTCSLGKSQPQFQGKRGPVHTKPLEQPILPKDDCNYAREGNVPPATQLPSSMFPASLGNRERELGKNPLQSAMCGSKEKRKPSTPNGDSQGENP